jgi:ATP-binding cassette subfamily F protein uup
VFAAEGAVRRHAGGYADWQRLGRRLAIVDLPSRTPVASAARGTPAAARARAPAKLSYKLKRELDELPARIDALERELAEHERVVAGPDFYAQPYAKVGPVLDDIARLRRALDDALARWDELETLERVGKD